MKVLNKDKFLNSIVIALFTVGITCILYVAYRSWKIGHDQVTEGNMACVKETTIYEVKDEHLRGLYAEGTKLKILPNYYQCNQVKRGDHVYFSIANGLPPVVRIVYGVPGDRYEVTEVNPAPAQAAQPQKNDKSRKAAAVRSRWNISVNSQQIQVNGQPYFIESNTVPPLRTYQLSRKGILGENEYIILSAHPPGLSDSSNLGLIHRERFIGKAVALNR